ncbi:MAG: type VI-D CRISPR-associated RNA-guided ribonuclease Cas13d, partial [Planctomycetaceae bacterium]|nr:type VI-D CRISPR-associated RNA-guided ribonuclease Cas13d [Planctomycetaceae bacterium]
MSDNKKTKAKRIGVSSVLLHNGDITITAFGKGKDDSEKDNDVLKKVHVAIRTDKTGSNLAQTDKERNITAKRIIPARGIEVSGTIQSRDHEVSDLEVLIANPADHQGIDYLKLKPVLEKEFFGKEFSEDNVRIQIIHNILDIQKILGIYVNDIIYAVNNLREVQDIEETPDILGPATPLNQTHINTTIGKLRDYFGFFGDAFAVPKTKDKNGKEKALSQTKETREICEKIRKLQEELNSPTTPRFKQENIRLDIEPLQKKVSKKDLDDYEKLAAAEANNKTVILSLYAIRQCSAHYKNAHIFFSADFPAALKQVEKRIDWNIIDNAYDKRISQINSHFLDQSKVNLRILFDMFPQDSQSELIESYYCFAILKQGKNLGVNMKKLRET